MNRIFSRVDEGIEVKFSSFNFSGGEVNVKLLDFSFSPVTIICDFKSSDDLMELLLLTDAIRRQDPKIHIQLVLPYLPYARQEAQGELKTVF